MNHDFNETVKIGAVLSSCISFNTENHLAVIRNMLDVRDKKMLFFNYGRNALRRIIDAVSKKGDKLAFQAFICPWLVEEAAKMGRIPVLVDSRLDTFNLDVKRLAEAQMDTKMTFVAHNFGVPVDMSR